MLDRAGSGIAGRSGDVIARAMTQVEAILAPALAPKFLVLYAFVLSAVAIHFRGRVRHRFFRQLTDHSTRLAHRDPYAGSLPFHLGLATPNSDKCRIEIDGEPYAWRGGEAIIFDETYIHSAINESGMDRPILFADVERPMTIAPARWLNRFFARVLMRASTTKNEEGEKVGALNKAFGIAYRGRVRMKALKKANWKLYYAIKCVTLGGLLSAFVVWA